MNVHSESSSVSPEGVRRANRRREQTRTALLQGARKVFSARGYADASIADITAAADVAVGTFYLYFPDKESLLQILLEEGMQRARAAFLGAIAKVQPEQALPVLLRSIFQSAYDDRELFAIALLGGPRFGLEFQRRSDLLASLLTVFEAAAARGLLPGYELPLLARLISGLVMQGVAWWLLQEEPHPDPAVMTEQVLRILREGLPHEILAGPNAALPSMEA